jgi:hypothetical protein
VALDVLLAVLNAALAVLVLALVVAIEGRADAAVATEPLRREPERTEPVPVASILARAVGFSSRRSAAEE